MMQSCSRYSKVCVFFALVAAVFVAFGLVVADLEPKAGLFLVGLFGLMFLWALYSVLDSYQRLVTLDDDGLTIHRSFRGPLRIEWAEIQSVAFSEAFWALKIRRVVGSSGSISVGMNGLGTLAVYLDRYAPGTIAQEARRYFPVGYSLSTQGVEADTKSGYPP